MSLHGFQGAGIMSADHAVSSSLFGGVERLIGRLQKRFDRIPGTGIAGGNTDADGEASAQRRFRIFDAESDGTEGSGRLGSTPGIAALTTAGILFAAMTIVHLVRIAAGWNLILGPWLLPPGVSLTTMVSLAAAGLSAGLSVWFFQQAAALR